MINYFKQLVGRINLGRNTTPKLVSLLFAIVLYIFVMGEINPEETRKYDNVHVQLLNLEELEREDLILIDQKDYAVEATVTGTRDDLSKISQEDLHITADLRGFKEGVSSIPLDIGEISNVKVKVSPMQIKVRLDEIVQRKKSVEIRTNGAPSEHFIASIIEANPTEIIVEGSKMKVETIDKIVGEVSLTDLTDDINRDVALRAIDSEGNDVIGVELKTPKVNVNIIIDSIKNVDIEVPITGKVKSGYKLVSVETSPKSLSIKGKYDLIQGLKTVMTEPINIEGLSQTVTKKVNLNLPEGVAPAYITDPISIAIKVEKIETKEFNYKARQILINNLDDELNTDISSNDSDVKVIISDVRSVLDKVKWSDLQLTIDAKDLPDGNYDLAPKLLNAGSYIKVNIVPATINVNVKSKSAEAPPASNNDVVAEPVDQSNNNLEDGPTETELPAVDETTDDELEPVTNKDELIED